MPHPLAEAEAHFAAGDLAAAEAAYLAAIPEHNLAYQGAAQCARRRADFAAALAHHEALFACDPKSHWVSLEIAADLRELGRIEEAEARYRHVLVYEPGNMKARIGLGACARHRGDRNASLALFQAAILADPDDLSAWLEAAADLRELGRIEEAQETYVEAHARWPESAYPLIGLGACARVRGDREEAIAFFGEAAGITPVNPAALLELSADLRALGRLDSAEEACRQVLERDPASAAAYLELGACARARGLRAAALRHFQAASRLAPFEIAPLLEIAAESRDSGDTDAARAAAQEVLARRPLDIRAILSLAETERVAGRDDAARAAYAQAHAVSPRDPGIILEMALAERRLGHQAKCDAYLAEALVLEPAHKGAIAAQAGQALLAGDARLAFEIFRGAAALRPAELEFQLGLLEAQAALGERDAALAGIAALEAARGALPALRNFRIQLLRQAGYYHAALALARESTARGSDDFWAWAARMETELLVGDYTAITACLRALPAASARERARARMFAGAHAESLWRIGEAIRHYEAAVLVTPEDSSIQLALVRVKLLAHDVEGAARHLHRSSRVDALSKRLRPHLAGAERVFLAQLLDDLRRDEELALTLARLSALAPGPRAEALRGVVRAHPDHTAPAIGLLVALRQSGALGRFEAGQGRGIPAMVMHYWDSADVPAELEWIMASWPEQNPDFGYVMYDGERARAYLKARFPPPVLQAFQRASGPAGKADIFRLAWLSAEGGVAAQADARCLRPVAALLPAAAQLVLHQEGQGAAGTHFIAAASRHPVVMTALAMAVKAVGRGDDGFAWGATGPGLLTRALAQVLSRRGGEAGICVLDRRELYQHMAPNCAGGYNRAGKT
jgi:Tfp pilus assembly protein PilF